MSASLKFECYFNRSVKLFLTHTIPGLQDLGVERYKILRQENLHVGETKCWRDELAVVTGAAFVCRNSMVVFPMGLQKAIKENEIVGLLIKRTRHIHGSIFNLNVFIEF